MFLYSVQEDLQFPWSEGAVSATIKHDVQGNEVAISVMDMGIHRPVLAGFRGDLREQPQHHRECFARGQICGCQREVLPRLSFPLLGTDSCPMKVHDGVFHVGYDPLPSVR